MVQREALVLTYNHLLLLLGERLWHCANHSRSEGY
jgi:hypothetical protein